MRNDELKHHGILGMKWGKRNGPPYPLNPSDRSAAETRLNPTKGMNRYQRAAYHQQKDADDLRKHGYTKEADAVQKIAEKNKIKGDERAADKNKKQEMRKAVKNRRHLSDDELNQRIRRLESEKKLRDLTNSEINRGRTHTKDFLSTYGKKIAGTAIVGATMYAGKVFVANKFKLGDVKSNFDAKELANYAFSKPKTK